MTGDTVRVDGAVVNGRFPTASLRPRSRRHPARTLATVMRAVIDTMRPAPASVHERDTGPRRIVAAADGSR